VIETKQKEDTIIGLHYKLNCKRCSFKLEKDSANLPEMYLKGYSQRQKVLGRVFPSPPESLPFIPEHSQLVSFVITFQPEFLPNC
jgi:hypothetical protein